MHVIEMELHDLGKLHKPSAAPESKIASVRIAEFETPEAAEKAIEEVNRKVYADYPSIVRLKLGLRKFYGAGRDLAFVFTKRGL